MSVLARSNSTFLSDAPWWLVALFFGGCLAVYFGADLIGKRRRRGWTSADMDNALGSAEHGADTSRRFEASTTRGNTVISVTRDGLTDIRRSGDLYSFDDATLGTWGVTGGMTIGTALHLQCGPRRLVLGGRDRRVVAGTRLEAPDAGYGLPVDVDAWVSASDFDEILAIAASSGLDQRLHDPETPIRCLLFPNPTLVQNIGSFAFRKQQEFMQSLSHPSLAIDIGADAIRVINPNDNTVIASVSRARVTATPSTYRKWTRPWLPDLGHLINDFLENYLTTMPYMELSIPGLEPLIIGTRDTLTGADDRFSWRGDVRVQNKQIDYVVSGADWLTLVEKFGFTPYLQEGGDADVAAA